MKKLFTFFMAFIMSLKTSTAYTPAPDKEYTIDTYMVEALDPPDYRDFYYGAEGEKVSQRCALSKFTSNGKRYSPTHDTYWFVDGQTVPSDLSKSISVKEGVLKLSGIFAKDNYIIAPADCTLKSHSKGSDGKSMKITCKINGQSYKLDIVNMGGWYCDVSRTGEIENHTGDDQYGASFRAGQVLGFATEDTTIEITAVVSKNNSDLKDYAWVNTIDQFYNGKWGVDANDTQLDKK